MPAAAVIPAPIAYIKVVAVKKLVVGSRVQAGGPPCGGLLPRFLLLTSRFESSLNLSPQCSLLSRSGWPERLL